jgi:Family of unknown function (DUF5723)
LLKKNAIKKISFLIVLLFICLSVKSQSYVGYHAATYNGVYAILTSPADILNHRIRADINLVGASAGVSNNIIRFKYSNRKNDNAGITYPNPIQKNGKGYFNTDVFGPSFLIRLSDKNAFAITTRARVIANVHGVSKYVLNSELQDTLDASLINNNLTLSNTMVNAHAWKEVALTYSRQIGISDYGVWKAGISLKYLGGLAAASFSTNNLSYTRDSIFDINGNINKDAVLNTQGSFSLNYTKNLDSLSDNVSDYLSFKNPGVGIDVGISYEYRDEMQVYETQYSDKTANYIWKLGASITDIGFIRYSASQTGGFSGRATGKTYLVDQLSAPPDSSILSQKSNYYKTLFNLRSASTGFTMQLPTTLHLTYDRFFNRWLAINAQLNMPLVFSKLNYYSGNFNPLAIAITPRAEITWAGVYMPFSYTSIGGLQVGTAIRLGPLVIGSGSLINARFSKTKKMDVYAILRVPLFGYHPHKKSKDSFGDPLQLNKKQQQALGCPKL